MTPVVLAKQFQYKTDTGSGPIFHGAIVADTSGIYLMHAGTVSQARQIARFFGLLGMGIVLLFESIFKSGTDSAMASLPFQRIRADQIPGSVSECVPELQNGESWTICFLPRQAVDSFSHGSFKQPKIVSAECTILLHEGLVSRMKHLNEMGYGTHLGGDNVPGRPTPVANAVTNDVAAPLVAQVATESTPAQQIQNASSAETPVVAELIAEATPNASTKKAPWRLVGLLGVAGALLAVAGYSYLSQRNPAPANQQIERALVRTRPRPQRTTSRPTNSSTGRRQTTNNAQSQSARNTPPVFEQTPPRFRDVALRPMRQQVVSTDLEPAVTLNTPLDYAANNRTCLTGQNITSIELDANKPLDYAWSSDGKYFAFLFEDRLWKINFATMTVERSLHGKDFRKVVWLKEGVAILKKLGRRGSTVTIVDPDTWNPVKNYGYITKVAIVGNTESVNLAVLFDNGQRCQVLDTELDLILAEFRLGDFMEPSPHPFLMRMIREKPNLVTTLGDTIIAAWQPAEHECYATSFRLTDNKLSGQVNPTLVESSKPIPGIGVDCVALASETAFAFEDLLTEEAQRSGHDLRLTGVRYRSGNVLAFTLSDFTLQIKANGSMRDADILPSPDGSSKLLAISKDEIRLFDLSGRAATTAWTSPRDDDRLPYEDAPLTLLDRSPQFASIDSEEQLDRSGTLRFSKDNGSAVDAYLCGGETEVIARVGSLLYRVSLPALKVTTKHETIESGQMGVCKDCIVVAHDDTLVVHNRQDFRPLSSYQVDEVGPGVAGCVIKHLATTPDFGYAAAVVEVPASENSRAHHRILVIDPQSGKARLNCAVESLSVAHRSWKNEPGVPEGLVMLPGGGIVLQSLNESNGVRLLHAMQLENDALQTVHVTTLAPGVEKASMRVGPAPHQITVWCPHKPVSVQMARHIQNYMQLIPKTGQHQMLRADTRNDIVAVGNRGVYFQSGAARLAAVMRWDEASKQLREVSSHAFGRSIYARRFLPLRRSPHVVAVGKMGICLIEDR